MMSVSMKKLALVFFFSFLFVKATAGKIHNRHFSLVLPESMIALIDTDLSQGELYVDTLSQVVLIVSELDSKFKSVSDYLDCSAKEIEQQLRIGYGDSALQLISCNRSVYYPNETTVLHFRVSILPMGYDTYMMYFIHHRKRDIQIAFIYKRERQEASMSCINAIMSTLKLK